MLQRDERETEILLGNKQLLGIFFVGAILLGSAFAGGYIVGRGGTSTKATPTAAKVPELPQTDTAGTTPSQGGETHSLGADPTAAVDTEPSSAPVLGAPKKKTPTAAPAAKPVHDDNFVPQSGQEFLQVAAVPRDHAVAVASVLRTKGFRAHAVAKPGDPNVYRVIIGPIRNAGELSSTRDSLRKTGFNQVLVQRYQ